MMVVPAITPVTAPLDGLTVALAVVDVHVPPEDASVRVMPEPVHTAEGPEIAEGEVFTVNSSVLMQVANV
jgi:hypothetical protein